MDNNHSQNTCFNTAFHSGEYVIYGTNGVCLITEVTTLDLSNVPKDRLYYVLHPVNSGEVIYIPVDHGETRLQKLLTKNEVMELIRQIPDIIPITATNEKTLEATYKSCIKSFNRVEWIKLIKCIYLRRQKRMEQGKKSTAVDERYMHLATQALYSELSLVLGIPGNEVEEFICRNIK